MSWLEKSRVARREMDFVIAKLLAPPPIENEQRVEPAPARECWRANQHVAPMRSRSIRNGLQPVLNFSTREFLEVHVIAGECAFGKQDHVTSCARGFGDESAEDLDVLRQ